MATTPKQSIPIEKLQALLDASDEMMRSVFLRDRKATLDTMARHICKLLNAESCAIFLVADDARDELVLESSFTEAFGDKLIGDRRLKIQSVRRGGFTGHIAHRRKIVRLTRRQWAKNKYVVDPKKIHRHLASGICFSVLGIPLKDQKRRLLGLLKPENKRGSDGKPGDGVVFDEVDERLARIIANKAVAIIECMRIEEDYRRSEVFFSSMVERLDQSVFCKDLKGRFTYVNKRFADRLERLELSPSDIIGKTDMDFYEPPFAERFRRDDIEVMETGKTKDVVETNRRPGGETRHVRVIKTPIRDASNKVVGVQGIFWDDTERYLLGTLLDNVPENIYFKDLKSRFTRINKHLAEQFRLRDPNDAVGRTDHDFFCKKHADSAFRTEHNIITSGNSTERIQECERYLDGRIRHVLTTKLPLRDSDGQIIGTFGISRNIDELVRAHDLFRNLLNALKTGDTADTARTLFEGLHQIFGYTSAMLYEYDEQKGYLNGKAAYGLNEDAVLTRTFFVGTKPSANTTPNSLVEAVFQKGKAVFVDDVSKPPCNQEGREILALKDGMSVIGFPLVVGKTFLGVMVVYSEDAKHRIGPRDEDILKPYADICALALSLTMAIQAAAFKHRADELQDILAKAVHEIKRPMHRMLQISSEIQDTDSVSKLQILHGQLKQQAYRAKRRLDNYLLRSIEGRETPDYEFQENDLGQIIAVCASEYRNVASEKLLKIQIDSSLYKLPKISCDADKIEQVFGNILDNAIKYSFAETRIGIEIWAAVRRTKVTIAISNHGFGITPSATSKIFEGYRRTIEDRTRFVPGTGIGLKVAKEIIEKHRGAITVSSKPFPGHSERSSIRKVFRTVFSVSLPKSRPL